MERRFARATGLGLAVRTGIVLLVIAHPAAVQGREYDVRGDLRTPEELLELRELGQVDDDTVDALVALFDRPVSVDRADASSLAELPEVTAELAAAIVRWRAEHGPFSSLDDLRRVPGVTDEVWEAVSPFVTLQGGPEDSEPPRPVRASVAAGSIWRGGADRATPDSGPAESDPAPQGWLRIRASGHGAEAGLVATYRRVTDAAWDASRGQLVTSGPAEQLELDDAYVLASRGVWRVVLGSFDVGFGERLTIDTTSRREPFGPYPLDAVYGDGSSGGLRVHPGLFGAAVSLAGVDIGPGWLHATLFGSWQRLDAPQVRGPWWGYDDGASVECRTASGCKPGYACDALLGVCHTSSVYDADEPAVDPVTGEPVPGYRYVTFDDAVRETLVGGNLTLALDEDTRLGLTAYGGAAEILLGASARPTFAPSSRYPRDGRFAAVGASGRVRWGPVFVSGEYARAGGPAAYARAVLSLGHVGEATLAARWYDAGYENPHGRGEAAPDLEGGLAARNELGARLGAVLTPVAGLRVGLDFDAWRPARAAVHGPDGKVEWRWIRGSPWDARARGRVSQAVTAHETAYVKGELATRAPAAVDPAGASPGSAPGVRRDIEIGGWTSRLAGLRLLATAALVSEDSTATGGAIETEQRYRVQASVHAWAGGSVLASAAHGRHASEPAGRGEGAWRTWMAHVAATQALGALTARLRYGVEWHRHQRSDPSPTIHVVEASVVLAL